MASYSFTLLHNKETLTVHMNAKESCYELSVVLGGGDPYTRICIPDVTDAHYLKDGPLSFTTTKSTIELRWGVHANSFYDIRRITVDMKAGTLSYEFWGHVTEPVGGHGFVFLFSHDFKTNPAPAYKLYRYKGELRAKLLAP
jgi:hypothetical protein